MPDEPLVRNFNLEAPVKRALPEKIYFWDETLRDGEQTPGVYYTLEEKVELAKILDDIGVSVLNCGIPAVSENELKAVKAVAGEKLRNASVLGACRTVKSDIDACIKADVDETSPFIAASEVHIRHKLKMTKEEVIQRSVEAIEYSKAHGLKTTFVTEDTVRADPDFVVKLYDAAIGAGADRVLFCDTVGVMTPPVFRWWLDTIMGRLKKRVQVGVHVHNDFGMATANTLAALESGVEVPNCTVNGMGERAGNCSFEEVVMALELLYDRRTGIKFDRLYEVSKLVEELSGVPVGITKPIIGYNAFTHESGIHTDGVIKHTLTYEPIQVETLKRQRRFVFGKHTGAAAVIARLKDHSIEATKEQVAAMVQEIKRFTEMKRKEEGPRFIHHYRDRDANQKGVTEREFWEIAGKAGVARPK